LQRISKFCTLLSRKFKHREFDYNTKAPEIVVPIILDLIKVDSLLDVGCGTGTWLKVFEQNGVHDFLGIDGDYVDQSKLYIDPKHFNAHDLRRGFDLNRRFDLVLCLEVGEHLPDESARKLVRSLVNHSDIIVFSTAIPGQGGQGHINEQWPGYWQKLFLVHDYHYHDAIRPKIWDNGNVNIWYRQNMFVVAKRGAFTEVPDSGLVNLVHPELWLRKTVKKKKISNTIRKWKMLWKKLLGRGEG
jgi:SAM-dependent methyltransferase